MRRDHDILLSLVVSPPHLGGYYEASVILSAPTPPNRKAVEDDQKFRYICLDHLGFGLTLADSLFSGWLLGVPYMHMAAPYIYPWS